MDTPPRPPRPRPRNAATVLPVSQLTELISGRLVYSQQAFPR
jgi:hypothetical protein